MRCSRLRRFVPLASLGCPGFGITGYNLGANSGEFYNTLIADAGGAKIAATSVGACGSGKGAFWLNATLELVDNSDEQGSPLLLKKNDWKAKAEKVPNCAICSNRCGCTSKMTRSRRIRMSICRRRPSWPR